MVTYSKEAPSHAACAVDPCGVDVADNTSKVILSDSLCRSEVQFPATPTRLKDATSARRLISASLPSSPVRPRPDVTCCSRASRVSSSPPEAGGPCEDQLKRRHHPSGPTGSWAAPLLDLTGVGSAAMAPSGTKADLALTSWKAWKPSHFSSPTKSPGSVSPARVSGSSTPGSMPATQMPRLLQP